MLSLNPAEIVCDLVGLVLAGLRAIVCTTQRKVTGDRDLGIVGCRRKLGSNVREPHRRRLPHIYRSAAQEIQARVSHPKLIEDVSTDNMIPRSCELFRVRRALVAKSGQRRARKGDAVAGRLIVGESIEPDRVILPKVIIYSTDMLVDLNETCCIKRGLIGAWSSGRNELLHQFRGERVEIRRRNSATN